MGNVANSYHIRIQAYELEKKIDDETVFILQFKHTRNVSFLNGNKDEMSGISLGQHGEYIKYKKKSKSKHDAKKSKKMNTFFDQIWLQHKSKAFLGATVNTIFRAFDCDDFILYNEHSGQFSFKFDLVDSEIVNVTKYVSLSRRQFGKEEAETLLKDRC